MKTKDIPDSYWDIFEIYPNDVRDMLSYLLPVMKYTRDKLVPVQNICEISHPASYFLPVFTKNNGGPGSWY
jgi:hypothetical protein